MCIRDRTVASRSHENNAVRDVSFQVRRGEIVCIAGIDGNGQTELVQGLTGLEKIGGGSVKFLGQDITNLSLIHIYIVTDGTGRKLRVHLLGTLVFLELDLDAGFLLKHFDGGGIQIFAVV